MESASKQSLCYKDKIIKQIEALPNKRLIFSQYEDVLIRKYYPIKGSAIAKFMDKTPQQVKNRAIKLGVRFI